MKLAVTDANIFIDLIKLQMLALLFKIDMEIHTTKEIVDQLNDHQFLSADFGSPGPLVHAVEAGGSITYHSELQHSLLRRPTPLTLWIYNRIINVERDRSVIEGHIGRMRLFANHPLADAQTKEQAQDFISHQLRRLG